MAAGIKEQKNNYKVNSRPILTLLIGLGFITVILLTTMLSAGNLNNNKLKSPKDMQDNGQAAKEDPLNGQLLAVVKKLDTDKKQITLFDVNLQESIDLDYSGGTNITDQYGKIIAASQIEIGSMVDAVYRKDRNKLTDMNVSTKAWVYEGVNNLSINRPEKTMKIAETKYKYNDNLTILDGQESIPIDKLAEQDELTIRGFEETIWSITVTRGHGTVVLEDCDAFLGDSITIGYESMQQITEDMSITVREGEFNLTVENGAFNATKSIRVKRNQITHVSLADLGPDALKHGLVTFEITPFGADLYVDGELKSYGNPLELLYGDHNISVSLGGYTSYEGALIVDSAGKTMKIDLPEASSAEEVAVSETNNNGTGSGAVTDNNGSGTDTGSGTDAGGQDTADNGSGADTAGDNSSAEDIDTGHLIFVQSPIGASVYIDGEYMGTSPCSFDKIIGTHVITFIQEGYQTMSYTIEVSDDGKNQYFTMPALVPE